MNSEYWINITFINHKMRVKVLADDNFTNLMQRVSFKVLSSTLVQEFLSISLLFMLLVDFYVGNRGKLSCGI